MWVYRSVFGSVGGRFWLSMGLEVPPGIDAGVVVV